jgi:DNA polymerase III subunit delta
VISEDAVRIYANQLSAHLRSTLASVYLIAGDEPLLVDECCEAVRKAAIAHGYTERQVLTAEPGFDWNTLQGAVQSLSLFSSKRLLELRLPMGVPAENGARMLSDLVSSLHDVLLLVSAGRLDKRAQNSRWAQALESAGVLVLIYPLEAGALPAWVAQRMRARGLVPERGVAELLAYHFEGNLLGAAQEVDKLAMLHGAAPLSLDDMREDLSDNARFSVFTLVDACLRGELASVERILASLRGDGTEPILILRVLAREARNMAQITTRLDRGERESQVFQSFGVWPRRRALVTQALRRSDADGWRRVLLRAARADKILKGRLPGDIWQELQCLTLAMCGRRTNVCQVMASA